MFSQLVTTFFVGLFATGILSISSDRSDYCTTASFTFVITDVGDGHFDSDVDYLLNQLVDHLDSWETGFLTVNEGISN